MWVSFRENGKSVGGAEKRGPEPDSARAFQGPPRVLDIDARTGNGVSPTDSPIFYFLSFLSFVRN